MRPVVSRRPTSIAAHQGACMSSRRNQSCRLHSLPPRAELFAAPREVPAAVSATTRAAQPSSSSSSSSCSASSSSSQSCLVSTSLQVESTERRAASSPRSSTSGACSGILAALSSSSYASGATQCLSHWVSQVFPSSRAVARASYSSCISLFWILEFKHKIRVSHSALAGRAALDSTRLLQSSPNRPPSTSHHPAPQAQGSCSSPQQGPFASSCVSGGSGELVESSHFSEE